ncbi:STAS domain-containing protein [Mycobacterium sp. GA-2829]|uniref:STAS domain-containing protein n=1 Tax=Mycobacterium sp. GA-2829 TaxID=1772283 RepID=UPI00073FD6A7|nr:STAS domain-containing protein [Mycobacterium sp. GA-2829]KUI39725.1 anti-anti-sigma factor [Mycobacterium sp. GA-2829]
MSSTLTQSAICHTARFQAAPRSPSATVVSAHGELDAVNAQQFADFAVSHAGCGLILDLIEVEFFSTAGFSALHTLNVRCAEADLEWTLVPSAAVRRLLQICDPDATLPTSETVAAALDTLGGQTQPLLQLVAEAS